MASFPPAFAESFRAKQVSSRQFAAWFAWLAGRARSKGQTARNDNRTPKRLRRRPASRRESFKLSPGRFVAQSHLAPEPWRGCPQAIIRSKQSRDGQDERARLAWIEYYLAVQAHAEDEARSAMGAAAKVRAENDAREAMDQALRLGWQKSEPTTSPTEPQKSSRKCLLRCIKRPLGEPINTMQYNRTPTTAAAQKGAMQEQLAATRIQETSQSEMCP